MMMLVWHVGYMLFRSFPGVPKPRVGEACDLMEDAVYMGLTTVDTCQLHDIVLVTSLGVPSLPNTMFELILYQKIV